MRPILRHHTPGQMNANKALPVALAATMPEMGTAPHRFRTAAVLGQRTAVATLMAILVVATMALAVSRLAQAVTVQATCRLVKKARWCRHEARPATQLRSEAVALAPNLRV